MGINPRPGLKMKDLGYNESYDDSYSINNRLELDMQFFDSQHDIKQIEQITKKLKMTGQQRREVGDYVESLKNLVQNDNNFSWNELVEMAKEFLEDF